MKKILSILLISVFIGSSETSEKKTKSKSDELQQRILGNVMGLNRLELTASFDECGEWGGHDEKFDIYRENKILYAEYIEDIVDCKDPYSENRKIAQKDTIRLNEIHEKAIAEYLKSLLEIGLKMELPSHAGTYYQAVMNDSTMILKYHSVKSSWTEYEKLKTELLK
ncbi:hypothetical protein [Tenacibaculum finnmarkense]|uniref:hypothetical protein n=1 Tax=Tenacibaculum finnmarkense TaxID=2781243 RepID=UPI001E2B3E24|nr:hypothetical protein [Tenacibaculum finnmarkense]MCD8423636.1 hypothetical protein [Tenacibaculum finnmarkense genomovar ulcerans]MCG8239791.1 hypothetical protein [Tenacibaculum finnmarkense genomovar ulcerans]